MNQNGAFPLLSGFYFDHSGTNAPFTDQEYLRRLQG